MSVATVAPPAQAADVVPSPADLLLVRLLPATKRPPSAGQVRTGLARFFRRPLTAEQWQEVIGRLRADGLLEPKGLRLTEAGRSRALAFLGVNELPSRAQWKNIQARYLVPKALGLAPDAEDTRKQLRKKDGLASLLLKRQFRLPAGTGSSLGSVLEALACKELGFAHATSLKDLKAAVLSRLLGSEERLSDEQLAKQLPRVLLGASRGGVDGLRDKVLRGWADGPEDAGPAVSEPRAADFDLPAFANTIKAAARDCPREGWFGDNKVFINHVWRRLWDDPGFPRLDLPGFKQRLIEANADNLLTLSRADLVQVMNPTDVSESETHHLNAVFHFVLVEREQP
jgi:hypothetical protein